MSQVSTLLHEMQNLFKDYLQRLVLYRFNLYALI